MEREAERQSESYSANIFPLLNSRDQLHRVGIEQLWRMDVEALITAIHGIPAIWNAADPKHSDHNYLSRKWSEVAEQLFVSGRLLF